jgi:molecular chaperone HscB
VICWSCERATGDDALCASCGAIQPAEPGADHFETLGLPARYALDLKAAEERFRNASRALHPDRFATADPRARRFATGRTVQLNEAWRTVKDPGRRAEYLLARAGFEVAAEAGASRPGAAGTREKIAVPPALLGEILDLREELADARAAGDDAHVQKLARDVRGRLNAVMERVAAGFERAEGEQKGSSQELRALEIVTHDLIEIRYLRRFLDEVDAHDEAVAAAGEPGLA